MEDDRGEEPETQRADREVRRQRRRHGPTIGVAAAGPRDDNGYYQSLVDFAEEFSAENGFAPPIVSDSIGAEEAAQKPCRRPGPTGCRHHLRRRVRDRRTAAGPHRPGRAVRRHLLVLQLRCRLHRAPWSGSGHRLGCGHPLHRRCGNGSGPRRAGQHAVGVPRLLRPQLRAGGLQLATVFGMQSVDPSLTMEYVSTGRLPVRLRQCRQRHGGAGRSRGQRRPRWPTPTSGARSSPSASWPPRTAPPCFAAGPADVCSRDDGD